jgi:23S rRNA (guanosine2251-2'-O)-methyltransferase
MNQKIDSPSYLSRKESLKHVITVYGRNTCLEALCDEKLTIYRLHLANTNKYNKRLKQLIALADSRKVSIRWHSKTQLARISRNSKQDQGVACDIRCPGYQHYKEIIDCMPLSQTTTLIALDGITNPINLGMIIRSVTASSAFGILLPSRGKPVLSPLAIKASAGTAFKCNILRCEELFTALTDFQQRGFQVSILDPNAPNTIYDFASPSPIIYILGSESGGISAAVKQVSNHALRIPMRRGVESLNVAAAAAILVFLE